jgi:polyferredoxin/Na+-translocating ferredoxin:NAD+ oxidoreductase RNF subunit RnfB
VWHRRLKLLRVVVALVVFAGLTAALVDFRGALPPRVGHWLASAQFVPSLVALVTGAAFGIGAIIIVVATLAAGRVYCSAICPLGILQDVIARVSTWWPGRKPPRRRYAAPVNWLRQSMLVATVAGIVAGWAGFALAVLDPYSGFGRIASALFRPLLTLANNALVGPANALGLNNLYRVEPHWAGAGVLSASAVLLVLLAVLVVWRGRIYCNTLCPVGTLLGWLARTAALRLEIDQGACTKCAECLRICKAQCIELRSGTIDFSRCVACYDCIGACGHGGIAYRWKWRRRQPAAVPAVAEPAPANAVRDPARRAFIAGAATALAASLGAGARLRADVPAPGRDPRGSDEVHPAGTGTAPRVICPPGSASIPQFLDRCTACQLCVSACPTHVLQPTWTAYGLDGLMKPRMDYTTAFCNYECRVCGEVCPSGAITLLDLAEKQLTQIGEARFEKEKCIVVVKGTDCAACSEHCPTKAVYTIPYGDNLRLPTVNRDLCIGCGGCEYACPAQPEKAITVASRREHGRAKKPVEQKAAIAPPTGDFPF